MTEETKKLVDEKSLRQDMTGNLRPLTYPEETANITAEHFALGPLDGRYSQIGKKLAPYFSEYALVKNRVKVEVMWLKFLIENVDIGESDILDSIALERIPEILSIYEDFSDSSFAKKSSQSKNMM